MIRFLEDVIFIILHPWHVFKTCMEIVGGGYAPLGVIISIIGIIFLKKLGVFRLVKYVLKTLNKTIKITYLLVLFKGNSLDRNIYRISKSQILEEKVIFFSNNGSNTTEIKHPAIIRAILKPCFVFKKLRMKLNEIYNLF